MLTLLALCAAPLLAVDKDSDRDGLSDFAEVHKYGTDPKSKDSDRDGIPDGDWHERREYAYVVRTVLHVLKPVTPEYLNDDFQDVRVLSESEDRFELEVVHYPFSTAPDALPRDTHSRRNAARNRDVSRWLEPGPSSDWDKQLRKELTAALEEAGIDVDGASDAELVRRASAWLVEHARSINCSTTFSTLFDERGRPYTPEALAPLVLEGAEAPERDWEGEVSAKGMFRRGQRGSCTSSAIYLSGCLRALGVPTRTILCTPIFDANDEREWAMVEASVQQPLVRRTLLGAMDGLRGAWASHTFNEVWIEGRWWRLDYSALGVGILRGERFGLLTHVGTFHDWADARAAETIGHRNAFGLRDPFLDGPNPYSMQSIGEEYGAHLDRSTLPVEQTLSATIEELYWTDDLSLPEDVLRNVAKNERFGLIARLTGVDGGQLAELLERIDRRIHLEAEGHPRLSVGLDAGCWWFKNDHALVYVPFGPADRDHLVEGVRYRASMATDEAPDKATGATVRLEGLEVRRGD